MFDTLLHVVRASKDRELADYIGRYASGLPHGASPRAIILMSSHVFWDRVTNGEDLIQWWAAATSAVPYTEEIAQSVVDTLLQIASRNKLLPHIPVDVWSWLTRSPSLPHTCEGRSVATCGRVVKAVRALGDLEVLKSYFLLTWSEWGPLQSEGFGDVWVSIREDFGGTKEGEDLHREDLIRRLDYILGKLDLGLKHLRQHTPDLRRSDWRTMKKQYEGLKALLEMGRRCTSSPMVPLFCVLILMEIYSGTSCNVHVRAPSSMTVVPWLLVVDPLLRWYVPSTVICLTCCIT